MGSADGGMIRALLREGLEGAVAPRIASSLLFDALADAGLAEPPEAPDALLDFTNGALRTRLITAVGENTTDLILAQVGLMIGAVLGASPRAYDRPSQVPTMRQSVEEGPVRVLVVSSGAQLSKRLRMALGPEVVAPMHGGDPAAVQQMLERLLPPIVLIDATATLPYSLMRLASQLQDTSSLVLVWGNEVAEAVKDAIEDAILLPPQNSELLVDYVLSRRAT
ncbi:MAG: hypothetical protein AB8I08_27810 [Sandaracinaceae bacterium]